jgi:formylglycine-generating enzyme
MSAQVTSDPDLPRREQVQCADPAMVSVPGGTIWMGSEQHDPEEAPVHRVTVSSFCIDRTQVRPAAWHAQPIDSGAS